MTEKTLTYEQLGIRAEDVFMQMGYHGESPDHQTQAETVAVISEVSRWLQPQFCFFVTPSSHLVPSRPTPSHPSLNIKGDSFAVGTIIERQLRGAEAYACFIATAGTAFEAYQQRLKLAGDLVRMFIADAVGSVIAEKCADQMERTLQESIDKLGWHHTNRFSPGYCGWHVSQQQLLFPLFEGHTCGVTLNDSSLMTPIKSVSGIVGIGEKVRRLDYSCGLCSYEKCFKRRSKGEEEVK